MKRLLFWESSHIEEREEESADITNEEGETIHIKMPKGQAIIHTEFGIFAQQSPNNPYSSREIFLAHTNFDITETDINGIAQIDGVEGLKPLTRYSFIIVIGLNFYHEDVLDSIEDYLEVENEEEIDEETEQVILSNEDLIKGALVDVKDNDFWFIYIMPNGEKICETFENKELMQERLPFFVALKNLSAGIFITSEENMK